MNPELKEKTQEQITEQRIAVLQEGFRKNLLESSIVRHTALKFLIKYYGKRFIFLGYIILVIACLLNIIIEIFKYL